MFESARIKLTAWYLLIIMLISVLFSVVIYANVNSDLIRIEERQRRILERQHMAQEMFVRLREQGVVVPPMQQPTAQQNLEEIAEGRNRLILVLTFINLGILGISGIAGFFLAGMTLKPIQDMVTEQRRFITDASHEFRTPLTSLRSEMEVNLKDKSLSAKGARKVITSNLEDVIRLQTLSDNLLELAQYESINSAPTFTTVYLDEVLGQAMKKVTGIAKKKKITVRIDIGRYAVHGNFDMLSELFVILLDNAIKYSPQNNFVTVNTKKRDHHVDIAIKDNGIGIDKADIPYIFERFYRTDTSRSKNTEGGYGLGLSIAKKIVDRHKGSITVRSKKSAGSTFIVNLSLKKT
jgi:two-component system, OmpR family, sensor histidine kinase CiaH